MLTTTQLTPPAASTLHPDNQQHLLHHPAGAAAAAASPDHFPANPSTSSSSNDLNCPESCPAVMDSAAAAADEPVVGDVAVIALAKEAERWAAEREKMASAALQAAAKAESEAHARSLQMQSLLDAAQVSGKGIVSRYGSFKVGVF